MCVEIFLKRRVSPADCWLAIYLCCCCWSKAAWEDWWQCNENKCQELRNIQWITGTMFDFVFKFDIRTLRVRIMSIEKCVWLNEKKLAWQWWHAIVNDDVYYVHDLDRHPLFPPQIHPIDAYLRTFDLVLVLLFVVFPTTFCWKYSRIRFTYSIDFNDTV